MRLDRAQAVLAPLPPWRAVDFGLALTRRWFGPVLMAWVAVVVPIQLLFYTLAEVVESQLGEEAAVAPEFALILVVWWLRPLFDQVVLFVLSRRLFGAAPTTAEVLRSVPALWSNGWFSALVLHRFDLARSFLAPVTTLEGLAGAPAKIRREIIAREGQSEAGWTTAVFIVFDVLLQVGVWGLVAWAWPDDPATEMGRWAASPFDLSLSPNFFQPFWLYFGVITLAVTEPFYVGAGFGLYLARRARLEGWDIEVQFRSLCRRLDGNDRSARRAVITTSAATAKLACLFILGVALMAAPALAQQEASASRVRRISSQDLPKETAAAVEGSKQRVKDQLRIGKKERETGWRFRFRSDEPGQTNASVVPGFSTFFGPLLSWLIWALFGLAVAAVVMRAWLQPRRGRDQTPTVELAAAVWGRRLDTLKTRRDLPALARELALNGDVTGAVAMLYRAAVVGLVAVHGAQLGAGATEHDCTSAAHSLLAPDDADYFAELTRVWQTAAYAHQPPDVASTVQLCDQWPTCLSEAL